MTTLTHPPRTSAPQGPAPGPTQRPTLRAALPWLSATWAAAYLLLAVLHLVRDTRPPWTTSEASVLAPLSATTVSVALVGLGALVLAALAGGFRAGDPGRARLAGGVLVGAGLVVALLIADARTLAFLGYLPMVVLGVIGIGPVGSIDADIWWDSLSSLGSSAGGLATVVTGLAVLRRARGDAAPRWSVADAERWGRRAVAVAVAVPLAYALTRVAWAAGIPLGVREEFLTDLGDGRYAGLGLAAGAVGGCLLTLGLVMRWGEVFWSWVPGVGGRPVPVALAVVPALFVASVVLSGGLALLRPIFAGDLADISHWREDWAAWVHSLFWPLWAVALAVAALAYRRRRLGPDATASAAEARR